MKVVSQKLRDSAKGKDCTLRIVGACNFDPATTVLAHLPCGQKGMGMKGFDIIAVYACSACHDRLDFRVKGDDIDARDLLRALAETQADWIQSGLMTIKGMK
jgi:hypothetical protein